MTLSEYWIEGIGSEWGPFDAGGSDGVVPDVPYPQLLCFKQNSIVKYINPFYNSCYFIPTSIINTANVNSEIALYPTPTSGVVTVNIEYQNSSTTFEVFDMLGNLVSKEFLHNKTQTLNFFKLSAGIYTYKVLNGQSILKIGRLIKQ